MLASALCQSCALCCDGSLFHSVPLEGRPAPAGAETVTREDGTRHMRLPCPALKNRSCSEYAARPAACQRYNCLLVRALSEGEIDLAEAQQTVEVARELIANVRTGTSPMYQAREAEQYLRKHFLGRVRI